MFLALIFSSVVNVVPLRINLFVVENLDFFNCECDSSFYSLLTVVIEAKSDFRFSKLVDSLRF